jgi:hypothetical protein
MERLIQAVHRQRVLAVLAVEILMVLLLPSQQQAAQQHQVKVILVAAVLMDLLMVRLEAGVVQEL